MGTVLFRIAGASVIPEIEMPRSATILNLKERIKARLDVDVTRQTLWFNDEELVNQRPIGSYDFQQLAIVGLFVKLLPGEPEFKILVKSSNKEANVMVKETYRVKDLRRKIEGLWGIPGNHMTLIRLSEEMEDILPLYDYYVCEGSEVEVRVNVSTV